MKPWQIHLAALNWTFSTAVMSLTVLGIPHCGVVLTCEDLGGVCSVDVHGNDPWDTGTVQTLNRGITTIVQGTKYGIYWYINIVQYG